MKIEERPGNLVDMVCTGTFPQDWSFPLPNHQNVLSKISCEIFKEVFLLFGLLASPPPQVRTGSDYCGNRSPSCLGLPGWTKMFRFVSLGLIRFCTESPATTHSKMHSGEKSTNYLDLSKAVINLFLLLHLKSVTHP